MIRFRLHRAAGVGRISCYQSRTTSLPTFFHVRSLVRFAPQRLRPTPLHRRCCSQQTNGTSDERAAATVQQQAMTLWERTKTFSNGVYRLYKDYVLYSNIHDAAQTAGKSNLHMWSKRKMLRHSLKDSLSFIIPWRQQAQQRQFLSGLYTVAPVVTLFMVPIVGYLPMLLSVVLPRQLLSRHFYNEYEILHYNQLAYQQRLPFYPRIVEFWPKTIMEHSTESGVNWSVHDICTVYNTYFRAATNETAAAKNFSFSLAALDQYPRDYLIALALSSGLYDTLPPSLQYWCAANGTPSWYLRRFLRQLARTIAHDDSVLCHEEQIVSSSPGGKEGSFVDTMTTVELMDACLLRGLRIAQASREEMTTALLQHLHTTDAVRKLHSASANATRDDTRVTPTDFDEQIGLFAIHLPILQQGLPVA